MKGTATGLHGERYRPRPGRHPPSSPADAAADPALGARTPSSTCQALGHGSCMAARISRRHRLPELLAELNAGAAGALPKSPTTSPIEWQSGTAADSVFRHRFSAPPAVEQARAPYSVRGGVRRYAFMVCRTNTSLRLAERGDAGGRVVVAHLGNSLCLCDEGRHLMETTMGFTAGRLPWAPAAARSMPASFCIWCSRGMSAEAVVVSSTAGPA